MVGMSEIETNLIFRVFEASVQLNLYCIRRHHRKHQILPKMRKFHNVQLA